MIAIVTKRILLSCIIILCFLTKNVTAQAANNPSYASNQLVDVVEPMWDKIPHRLRLTYLSTEVRRFVVPQWLGRRVQLRLLVQ